MLDSLQFKSNIKICGDGEIIQASYDHNDFENIEVEKKDMTTISM